MAQPANIASQTNGLTIGLEDLAAALGLTPAALKRRHRALHEKGLPLPMTYGTGGCNWRWPGEATRLFLRTGGPAGGPAPQTRAGASSGGNPANDNGAAELAEAYVAEANAALHSIYRISS